MRRLWRALLIAVVVLAVSGAALADEWQWPSQMSIGGFTVRGISGSVRPDGSGSATGQLEIPGAGSYRISLTRSSGGSVTGEAGNLSARIGGVEIQGRFSLSSNGLGGGGTVRVSPRPITDAQISIGSGGQLSGRGRVEVGRSSVNVSFSVSGSLNVNGSANVKDEKDTPLATYKFDGRLSIDDGSGRLSGSVSGNVRRTGKLANQVTNHSISGAQVNLNDGSCTVNVGGVGVTFRF